MANATLFEHINYGGRSMSFGSIVGNVNAHQYEIATFNNFASNLFNDLTSSLSLLSTVPFYNNSVYRNPNIPKSKNTIFLFENAGFQGGFFGYYFDSYRQIPNVQLFNDLTSSALIVQHPNLVLPGLSLQQTLNPAQNPNLPYQRTTIDDIKDALVHETAQGPFGIITVTSVNLVGKVTCNFVIDKPGHFGEDLVRVDLPVQLIFKRTTPNITCTINVYIKLSVDSNSDLNFTIVDSDVTNFGHLSSLLLFGGTPIFLALIRNAIKNKISSFPLPTKHIGYNAKNVYTMPWMPSWIPGAYNGPFVNYQRDLSAAFTDDVAFFLY